ncbi:MAG: cell surface protein, partial [Bacteroidota bacterium]
LHMVAGDTVQSQVGFGQVIEKQLKASTPPETIIENLYLRSLSRKPKPEELKALLELVGSDTKDRKPYQDIFWSLLNSTEFIFNH